MKVYRILPDKSIRYGLIEVLSQFPEICGIEYGPEGTMHYLSAAMADRSDNVFTSGIKEKDIIFGTTDILERAALDIDQRKNPRYLILIGSCVTEIIGTDITAVARKLQSKVRAKKVIAMGNISFEADYADGWKMFSQMIAKEIIPDLPKTETHKGSYHILGLNQTDYHGKADRRELRRMLSDYMGLSCLNKDNGAILLDDLGKAQFNLVLRREALPVAEALRERFGTPYLLVCPYGVQQSQNLLEKVSLLCGIDFEGNPIYQEDLFMAKRASLFLKNQLRSTKDFSMILHGDYDRVSSLWKFFHNECMVRALWAVDSSNSKAPKENVLAKKSEKDFIAMMKEKHPYLLISNEVYCDYFQDISKGFPLFTPLTHMTDINEFSPYMGMRGTINLAQEIVNTISRS